MGKPIKTTEPTGLASLYISRHRRRHCHTTYIQLPEVDIAYLYVYFGVAIVVYKQKKSSI